MAKLFENSGDPDQMLHFAASDLGLHYLPITFLEVFQTTNVLETSFFYCDLLNVVTDHHSHYIQFSHHENMPYVVKLGFTGVYIIFLISAQKAKL